MISHLLGEIKINGYILDLLKEGSNYDVVIIKDSFAITHLARLIYSGKPFSIAPDPRKPTLEFNEAVESLEAQLEGFLSRHA